MAFRTWAKLLAATLGVGALAGASQLGLVYGLGIVRLTRVLDVTSRDQWTAQLAWVAWIPMLAAVVGALVGAALLRRWSPVTPVIGVGTELALAFAAAIGAGVVVPLTMQPARTAQVAGVDPVVVIAIGAGLGALVGVFAAWAALAQTVARWSLVTMAVAVWTIALISVAPSLAPSDPLPAVRLGVFDAGFLSPAVTQRTALATMPALALLIGATLGWLARRRDLPTLTIALAGLPGPALLTIAYLIAGPGAGDDRYQVVPYWAAMTATGAGVLGSVLAAVLRRSPDPDDEDTENPAAGADQPPLPQRTGQPESAIAAAGAAATPAPVDPGPRPVDTGVIDLPPRGRPVPDSPTATFPATGAQPAPRPDPLPGFTDAGTAGTFGTASDFRPADDFGTAGSLGLGAAGGSGSTGGFGTAGRSGTAGGFGTAGQSGTAGGAAARPDADLAVGPQAAPGVGRAGGSAAGLNDRSTGSGARPGGPGGQDARFGGGSLDSTDHGAHLGGPADHAGRDARIGNGLIDPSSRDSRPDGRDGGRGGASAGSGEFGGSAAGRSGSRAGLGGSAAGPGGPAAARIDKPLRKPRRSSVADAFIARTGEFPAARGNTDPVQRDTDPARPGADPARPDTTGASDFRNRTASGTPGFADRTDQAPAAFDPSPRDRSYDRDRDFGRDHSRADEAPRSADTPWSPTAGTRHPQVRYDDAGPYVPEPATRPLPPGTGTGTGTGETGRPAQPREPGGRFGRALRPFGKNRNTEPPNTQPPNSQPPNSQPPNSQPPNTQLASTQPPRAEPLTPEPTPVSAPLPTPEPISPPLAVTPVQRPASTPKPDGPQPEGRRKGRSGQDEDYVDWVSGLGK